MHFELDVSNMFDLLKDYKGAIYYGIPEFTNSRAEGELGNADILAINEAGSLVNNVPARPLLKPAIEKHQEQVNEAFLEIASKLLEGDEKAADDLMIQLAGRVEGWVKRYFVEDNGWAPNSPITIHGGWMKNRTTGKPIYIKGKGSDRPLIDTGNAGLRGAIRAVFKKE